MSFSPNNELSTVPSTPYLSSDTLTVLCSIRWFFDTRHLEMHIIDQSISCTMNLWLSVMFSNRRKHWNQIITYLNSFSVLNCNGSRYLGILENEDMVYSSMSIMFFYWVSSILDVPHALAAEKWDLERLACDCKCVVACQGRLALAHCCVFLDSLLMKSSPPMTFTRVLATIWDGDQLPLTLHSEYLFDQSCKWMIRFGRRFVNWWHTRSWWSVLSVKNQTTHWKKSGCLSNAGWKKFDARNLDVILSCAPVLVFTAFLYEMRATLCMNGNWSTCASWGTNHVATRWRRA